MKKYAVLLFLILNLIRIDINATTAQVSKVETNINKHNNADNASHETDVKNINHNKQSQKNTNTANKNNQNIQNKNGTQTIKKSNNEHLKNHKQQVKFKKIEWKSNNNTINNKILDKQNEKFNKSENNNKTTEDDIKKLIEDFFNKTEFFSKEFVQSELNSKKKNEMIGKIIYDNKKDDKGNEKGKVVILKYSEPHKNILMASNKTISFYDSELKERSVYSTSSSPLSIVLEKKCGIKKPIFIESFSHENGIVKIYLKKHDIEGMLILIFHNKNDHQTLSYENCDLKKWIIVDAGKKQIIALDFFDTVSVEHR